MIYLVDTDVGIALCDCNCIQYLPQALSCGWEDIFFDSELRKVHRFRLKNPRRFDASALYRLGKLVRDCRMINERDVCIAEFDMCLAAGANEGESELFAAVGSFYPREVRVITGDHKALKDVHIGLPSGPLRDRLQGTIVCIEQVLKMICDVAGYDAIEADLGQARGQLSFLEPYFSVLPLEKSRMISTLDLRIGGLQFACPKLLSA